MKRKNDSYENIINQDPEDDLLGFAGADKEEEMDSDVNSSQRRNYQKYSMFDTDTLRDNPPFVDAPPQAGEEPFDPSLLADVCSKENVCPACSCSDKDNQAELQALEEERLRMFAEMDNFKKRLTREQEERARYASAAVLSDILPSLDNFELALTYGRANEACREMVQGLEMTQKLLLDALAAHGLEKVGVVGEQFNPEVHEAMTQEKRDDMAAGHVSQVFQTGYKLNDRLLRPAKVVVSS